MGRFRWWKGFMEDEPDFNYNLCKTPPTSSNKTYIRKCCISAESSLRESFWKSPSHNPGWLVVQLDEDEDYETSNTPNDAYTSNSNLKFGDCFLLNPVSSETIQLPTLLPWIHSNESSQSDQYIHLHRCVFSSPAGNFNSDSMVFIFFYLDDDGNDGDDYDNNDGDYDYNDEDYHYDEGDCYVLVFCRPGDKQWRRQKFPAEKGSIQSLIFFEGNKKLYVICKDGLLVEVKNFDDETLTTRSYDLCGHNVPLTSEVGGSFTKEQLEYVKSRDELFKVIVYYFPICGYDKVLRILVFRMDFSVMAWEEVKSLGDHVLFLGKNYITSSCSAAEFGLTRGCVYYMLPNDRSLYKFDLEDNNILVSSSCQNLPPTSCLSPDWVIITATLRVNNVRRKRRKTEDMLGNDVEEDSIISVVAEENKFNVKENEKEDQGKKKKNEGKLEESITWGFLSEDILKLIASFLHPIDYIHFRAISKANRSVIPAVNWRTSSVKITQITSLSPWLVFYKEDEAIYNFVDPMHNNEKYLMNLSELLLGARIRFSKGGWLLMSKGKGTVFFFNPFTTRTIQLPSLGRYKVYKFSGISFSSLPTSSDCVVFAITGWSTYTIYISFITRGKSSWSSGEFVNTKLPAMVDFKPCPNNPVFFDATFYCLDRYGTLGVFRFERVSTWTVLAKPETPCTSFSQCFLVECDGRLLSVFLGNHGEWVRIFRLDSSKKNWVKVESLGKHTLFISNTSCLSAVAPDSHMENKVYFSRFHGERILLYSLDTGRYHSLGSEHSAENFYHTKEQLDCSWIEPNWSQNTDEELEWPNRS